MSALLEAAPAGAAQGVVRRRSPRQERSALDAAALVVGRAKHPLTAAEIVERMEQKGLWKSISGKTPASTVSAAILREIFRKGPQSRFRKAGRGTYAAAGKGK